MSSPHIQTILSFPLFGGYTDHGAQGVLSRGEIVVVPASGQLFREGEESAEVVLILSGRTRAFVERRGKEIPLGEQKPGAILGEIGVLCNLPRSASVQAVDETTVLRWPTKAFRSMLLSDPVLSERIFRQSLR